VPQRFKLSSGLYFSNDFSVKSSSVKFGLLPLIAIKGLPLYAGTEAIPAALTELPAGAAALLPFCPQPLKTRLTASIKEQITANIFLILRKFPP